MVEDVLHVMDHDHVLFFTADGVARSIRAHQIPPASRTALGTAITQVGTTTFIPVSACGNRGGPAQLTFRQLLVVLCAGLAQHNLLLLSSLSQLGKVITQVCPASCMSGCSKLCTACTAAMQALAPHIACPKCSLLALH